MVGTISFERAHFEVALRDSFDSHVHLRVSNFVACHPVCIWNKASKRSEPKKMPESSERSRLSSARGIHCESWRVKFFNTGRTRNPAMDIEATIIIGTVIDVATIDATTDMLPFTLLRQFYLRLKKSERRRLIESAPRIVSRVSAVLTRWLSPRPSFRGERRGFLSRRSIFDLKEFGW